jgi:phage-related protein
MKIKPGITDWANKVAGVMIALVRIIGQLFSWLPILGKGFQALAHFSLKPVSAQNALGSSMNNTRNATNGLTDATKGLNKELGKLAAFDEMNVLSKDTGAVNNFGGFNMGGIGGDPLGSVLDVGKINEYADNAMAIFNGLFGDFTDWGTKIQNFFVGIGEGITNIWNGFLEALTPSWEANSGNILTNLEEFKNNTIKIFQSIWDNVVSPIVTPMLNALTQLWNEHFSKVVDAISSFILKLINFALVFYNRFIAPIILSLLTQLKPVFEFVGNFIGSVIYNVGNVILTVIENILNGWGRLLDFLSMVFKDQWRGYWLIIQMYSK